MIVIFYGSWLFFLNTLIKKKMGYVIFDFPLLDFIVNNTINRKKRKNPFSYLKNH